MSVQHPQRDLIICVMKKLHMLSLMAFVGTAASSPITLVTDKYCGLQEGKDRYNINMNGQTFLTKFGVPDKKRETKLGDRLPVIGLDYEAEGLFVAYRIDDGRITQFMFDLEKNPDIMGNDGVKLNSGTRQLSKIYGPPTEANDYVISFKTPGCKLALLKNMKGENIRFIINALDF